MRREQACLVADLACCDGRGRTRDRRRPGRVRAETVGRRVRVAVFDLDVADREAELLGDDLRERRLVALALRLHTDSREYLARWMDADLARVEHLQAEDVEIVGRACPDNFRERADADAHQFAALALLLLFTAQPFV